MRGAVHVNDYARLDWGDIVIDVIPLPGHTFGSVGYLFDVTWAGRRLGEIAEAIAYW